MAGSSVFPPSRFVEDCVAGRVSRLTAMKLASVSEAQNFVGRQSSAFSHQSLAVQFWQGLNGGSPSDLRVESLPTTDDRSTSSPESPAQSPALAYARAIAPHLSLSVSRQIQLP